MSIGHWVRQDLKYLEIATAHFQILFPFHPSPLFPAFPFPFALPFPPFVPLPPLPLEVGTLKSS